MDESPNATTIDFRIVVDDRDVDALVAQADQWGATGFWHDETILHVYFPADRVDDALSEQMAALLKRYQITHPIVTEVVEAINWNAAWESSYDPVTSGRFWIHASWHNPDDSPPDLEPLCIDPKMSFGTGHHETTHLVLTLMEDLSLSGRRVLDVGTGTGVLAIAAIRQGANMAVGMDVDEWSTENARENAERNGVAEACQFEHGTIDVIERAPYDLILANINKQALLDYWSAFGAYATSGTILVISGILNHDEPDITAEAVANGFTVSRKVTKGDWKAMQFTYQPEHHDD